MVAGVELHGHRPAVGEQGGAFGVVVEEGVLVVPDGLRIVLPGEDLAGTVEGLSGGGLQA